ncbi:MAG TPA: maltose ABC transporter permease MalF [Limnochordales bacterium]
MGIVNPHIQVHARPSITLVAKIVGLGLVDGLGLWAALVLMGDRAWGLLAALAVGLVAINLVVWVDRLFPYRYLLPGLVFMVATVVYPILYTVVISTTNYGTGHILTKQQAIAQITGRHEIVPGGRSLPFDAFRDPDGRLALLLYDEGKLLWGVLRGDPADVVVVRPLEPSEAELVDADGDGRPERVGPFEVLSRRELLQATTTLQQVVVDDGRSHFSMRSVSQFVQAAPRYRYDPSQDAIVDLKTNTVYRAVDGFFVSPEGQRLTPGFRASVGLDNYRRLFTNPQIAGPFLRVLVWTLEWAALSVVTTFTLGLFLAVLLNDPFLRFRTFYRTVLIIPYALPAFISALVWRGLYNTELGVINRWLGQLLGVQIPWLQDPFWAKVALIILNLWLGFPYMMVVSLGALQSIPSELYEAATVDGASPWQQFRWVTFPLLLIAVAPLLVASFAFNFNNFVVIYLLTEGRPPIPGAQTPAGATDILISYTYRLAFESGWGADYGLASAVAILIFFFVGTLSYFNFKWTRALEEVRQSV